VRAVGIGWKGRFRMMSAFVVNGLASRQPHVALHVGGAAALALVLVAGGAFGSDDMPLASRILMFGVISALLVAQASAIAEVALRYRRLPFMGPARVAIMATTTTLLVMTLEIHMLKATPIVPYDPDPLPEFAIFLSPFVVPVSLLVLGLKWSGHQASDRHSPRPAGSSQSSARKQMPFAGSEPFENWPWESVLRIRVIDHYLELGTAQGSRLVRGRMRDAIRKVPRFKGIQPHRSWWVAFSEIDRIERRGRDLFLLLTDGEHVPIARARALKIKSALASRRDR
jgi:hypothetical protein